MKRFSQKDASSWHKSSASCSNHRSIRKICSQSIHQKRKQKQYIRHTEYPGGQRNLSAEQIHKKNNTRLIEKSIKGMLPKNKLGAELFRNLRVYPGDQHQQEGQNPTNININDLL